MDHKDYYKVLGVSRTADADTIKKAYRKLARKYHPDVSREPDAVHRIKEVNEAWEVLGDAQRRATYDRVGADPGFGGFGPPPGWNGGGPFAGQGPASGAGGGEFSDFFNTLFGRGRTARPQASPRAGFQARGQDHHQEIQIDLEDSLHGATRELSLRTPRRGHDGHVQMQQRTLSVRIPQGIRDGQTIRLAGQGGPGQGGGVAGDLLLEVRLRPHPVYRFEDGVLRVTVPVAPWEAALGAEVKVPTPGGEVEVRVPRGTGHGRTMRLRGRGLPTTPPGDLYLDLEVVVPPADTAAAQQAWERLARDVPFDPRAGLWRKP